MNVLFLCTGNACRSILAEATFNHLAPTGWQAMSAGSRPPGQVHPRSLALLAREGTATEGCHSKSWEALPAMPEQSRIVALGALAGRGDRAAQEGVLNVLSGSGVEVSLAALQALETLGVGRAV